MIDKKTESDIKSVKDLIEIWAKFHSVYNDITSKEIISKETEDKFLEEKLMVASKYDELRSGLDFKYVPHGRLTDPVSDILAMDNIRFISEKNIKKIGDDWRDSYIFLNNIFERLKNKKRRLEEFSTVGVFLKKMFSR